MIIFYFKIKKYLKLKIKKKVKFIIIILKKCLNKTLINWIIFVKEKLAKSFLKQFNRKQQKEIKLNRVEK